MDTHDLKTGSILVASSAVRDPALQGAVILVLKHDDSGTLGVNIAGACLKKGAAVYYGGPGGGLRFLHRRTPGDRTSAPVEGTGYAVRELAEEGGANRSLARFVLHAHAKDSMLLLGSCVWEKGQLEAGIGRGDWQVSAASLGDLMKKHANHRTAAARRETAAPSPKPAPRP